MPAIAQAVPLYAVLTDGIVLRAETAADVAARERLLDRVFGPQRFLKTCERLREERAPAEGLAFSAFLNDAFVGTLRFWSVDAGGRPALMLGPIAIDPAIQAQGLGGRMIRYGLARASALGHQAVLLVGDAPYYQRFGFARADVQDLVLPGPVELPRFLGLELQPGGFVGAKGLVRATGDLLADSLRQAA